MIDEKWSARHITDSAQRILKQVPSRANDRGMHVVDGASLVMLTLWSLLLWERKVGRVALEQMGVDPFELARGVDGLLTETASEHPVVYDRQRGELVLVNTGEAYKHWNFAALLEPLLQQAEHESQELVHNYVGSEHLLLAIIRLANPPLSALLQTHGINHLRTKEAVVELLFGQTKFVWHPCPTRRSTRHGASRGFAKAMSVRAVRVNLALSDRRRNSCRPLMTVYLKWPDEFPDPTPATNFGGALTELLKELVQSGCGVIADQHWSWFSVSCQGRMIDFVRRGRLGYNRDYCWEVRLSSDEQPVQLGKIFGIHEYACVVIAGIDDLRNVTKRWLAGEEIQSLLRLVTFWDKMDTKQPLRVPDAEGTAEAR